MSATAPNLNGGTPPPAADPGGGAPAQPWYGDADKGYIENKKWSGPRDVIESYRNLERIQRTPRERLLELPERDDDAEGWAKVHGRLGRPDAPEGYDLPPLQITDGQVDLSPEFRKWAHEHGLSNKAAKGLAEKFMGHTQALRTAADEKYNQQAQLDEGELKREWGGEFDRNVGLARQIVAKLYQGVGYDKQEALQADLTAIEHQIGHKRFMKMFAFLGRGLGDAPFIEGGGANARGQGFGMTPDAARSQLDQLRNDGAFMAKAMAGNTPEADKLRRLTELATQGQSMGGPPPLMHPR